jgi:hypothetical protein
MEVDRSKLRDMVAGFHTNTDAEKAAFIDGWNMADNNPDWRDVRKELPTEDGEYLAYLSDIREYTILRFKKQEGAFFIIFMDEAGETLFGIDDVEQQNVTLWMPLPEIPIPSTAD